MAFVRINGVLLHYRLAGPEGAPGLVLVNALGTDARIWDKVVAAFATERRVLSYDKRGHGLSDTPPGAYSLADHLGDLAGLIDHARLERVALAGVSVGGLIAQGFALAHPERLAALVLCDTAPRLGDAATWNGRIATVLDKGTAPLAEATMERWFGPRFRAEHADEVAGWRNMLLRTDPRGYGATCATLRDTDLGAQVGRIATPTLVVVGDEDGSTPVPLVRACAEAIPGARFEILGGAGHIPAIDRPEALVRLMRGFFEAAGAL
jgi:3-oxoadipate enol-lactonase